MPSSLGFISSQTRADLTHVMEPAIVQAQTEKLNEKRRKMLADAEKLARIGSFEWDIQSIFARIHDSGKGIPPEEMESLFEIGFTARSSKVRLRTGLFNTYNIVQKHGGDITVQSELGRGATFTIRLPIRQPHS